MRLLWPSLAVVLLLYPALAEEHNYQLAGPAPGSIRFKWIHGSICAATNRDPRVQAVMYNEDTYILRENIAIHYDAPFTYLLMGNKGALLVDTGATEEAEYYPLRATVDAILKRWGDLRGKTDLPLTVVLTSPEYLSENQGYRQFVNRPNTTLVPLDLAKMKAFYGLTDSWPNGTGRIDLGGRIITVIPTPGAHKDGVTFYDSYNGFLLTGHLLFPGRVMISNDADYVASLTRLKEFSAQHPVKWVLGSQIDMKFLPGVEYMRLIRYKPDEHLLQLEPTALQEALATATRMLGKPEVAILADFTMRNRVGPDERPGRRPANLPRIPQLPNLR
ncbi:hypothetical protein [uncultured Paludibaculum sp.]|uniref:hypothetical protein n=1 Tax=uncultured Paludibaculum sp. TaxID=1765020 RepID=UPI002AAA6565|nr:hypothetical protein [uncultured Paludibaculum sp.]